MKDLTSIDLFSGAGGFTEGFRQAGYCVVASLDNWAPAVETHEKNHPGTEMFRADILEFDPEELPRADVLVGSPPCTEFSYANQGGHGDLDLGMRFVLRFLRFVHDLKPRYWAMENVPRLLQSPSPPHCSPEARPPRGRLPRHPRPNGAQLRGLRSSAEALEALLGEVPRPIPDSSRARCPRRPPGELTLAHGEGCRAFATGPSRWVRGGGVRP